MSEYQVSTQYEAIDVGESATAKMKDKYEALERLAGILKDENRDLKQLVEGQEPVRQHSSSPFYLDDVGFPRMNESVRNYALTPDGRMVRATYGTYNGSVRTLQYIEIEELRRQLRTVSAQVVDAQEQERKRVSRDLHDGVCQSLIGLRILLETVLFKAETEKANCQMIRQALETARKTENDIRCIMAQLKPPNLKEQGLKKSIEQALDAFKLSGSLVDVRSEITADPADIRDSLQVVMYRIVQEAINNIYKHSDAKTATVSLRRDGSALQLVIEDNGNGFDPRAALNKNGPVKGMGLTSMQDRVHASCGKFMIETEVGRGTRIVCEWDANLHKP
ncbi:MAG: sensor histidine kinase [Deltaproteobacteria bacterium]|nr:sensor histidine kinase [Deltaproteobacteria bacterium]